MATKLGAHVLRTCDDLGDYIQAKPAVVKLVGDWGMAGTVPEGVLVVGRKHQANYDAQHQYKSGLTPRQAAEKFVQDQLPTYQANLDITYWEGHNEPVWNTREEMLWYAEFEAERMKLMADLGLKCVIGNFATGTPDLALWEAFWPACLVGRGFEALLGLHEYSCPWMWWMTGNYQKNPDEDEGDEGWTTLRYRKVYRQYLAPNDAVIPLVITECGIDPLVSPKPAGCKGGTWKSLGNYWKQTNNEPDKADYYFRQLVWYDRELQKDDYVVGATVFTWGNYGEPWASFDVAGTDVSKKLVAYTRENPAKSFAYDVGDTGGEYGQPRVQYERTYVLLPPAAGEEWAAAVLDATWDDHRYTVGGSADDAGIGDLDVRKVVAVNPAEWPSDLEAFFDEHYPGVELETVTANTPDLLRQKLTGGTALEIDYVVGQLATNPNSPWYPWKKRTGDEITHIFVHHSAGALSASLETVKGIARAHTSASGKNRPGICYTYVIGSDGHVWQVSEVEDVVFSQGSATYPGDENRWGLGVCLLGCFTDGRIPTQAQRDSLDRLISHIQGMAGGRSLKVWGHKDVASTQCPGDWWPPADRPGWGRESSGTSYPLLGLHGRGGGEYLANQGVQGWCLDPVYMNEDYQHLDYTALANAGIRVVVNLRRGWSTDCGGQGTIPPVHKWERFTENAVKTIRDAKGVYAVTVFNEANNPREWPHEGDEITPWHVAELYNAIWRQVKDLDIKVGLGALDPFYGPGSDCREWFRYLMANILGAKVIGLHGYIRGPVPELVDSDAMFTNDPLKWQYLNYYGCVETFTREIPSCFLDAERYITEFNHLWLANGKIGWDPNATAVIEAAHRRAVSERHITALIMYRWSGDEWKIEDKPRLLNKIAELNTP